MQLALKPNFDIMKKPRNLLLAMIVCSITTVSAEKMSLCQAFVKLAEQCKDFSAWKGGAIPDRYGNFYSTLEVEGGKQSYMYDIFGDLSFMTDFGTFDTENAALQKVESLKKEILNCYSFFKFADTKGPFGDNLSYFVQPGEDAFRFYTACFKISKYKQTWTVTFQFPQNQKESAIGAAKNAYTDYKRIKLAIDNYAFSQDVRKLLDQAKTGFASVKGEKLDNIAVFQQYSVTFQPTGKEDCYIEDRGMGLIFYEIPILQDVTMETLQGSVGVVLTNIQRAFGPEYGFIQSPDGMTVSFAHQDHPYYVAATLYIEKIMDGYNMNLSLKAEPKPL